MCIYSKIINHFYFCLNPNPNPNPIHRLVWTLHYKQQSGRMCKLLCLSRMHQSKKALIKPRFPR